MNDRRSQLLGLLGGLLALAACPAGHAATPPPPSPPVKIILDTDMGNDVDDAFALAAVHALAARGKCELLAVTLTKFDELAAPYVDAVNTFYGRGDIPIAALRRPVGPADRTFVTLATVKDGAALRYPHDLLPGAVTPEPVALLRRLLSQAADQSIVLVQIGFFTNFAALLDSAPDELSPLPGRELVARKVRLLSVMAGAFPTSSHNDRHLEFNVIWDIAAARRIADDWPTPIIWSGYEIGNAVTYPASSVERDFGYVPHHPLAESYYRYRPPPHERPMWDYTSVLQAVLPDRDYFELSTPGRVAIEADGFTRFTPEQNGRDRFLILDPVRTARVREALVVLCTEPPVKSGRQP